MQRRRYTLQVGLSSLFKLEDTQRSWISSRSLRAKIFGEGLWTIPGGHLAFVFIALELCRHSTRDCSCVGAVVGCLFCGRLSRNASGFSKATLWVSRCPVMQLGAFSTFTRPLNPWLGPRTNPTVVDAGLLPLFAVSRESNLSYPLINWTRSPEPDWFSCFCSPGS